MKFEIKNRWTGDVQFTAEIECKADELPSIKLGLAVKFAVKEKANLDGANLDGANLDGANLYGANLTRANLTRANLTRANLDGANLYGANLTRANLTRANLDGANLTRANLDGANLYGANLTRANLDGANLWVACGNRENIKSLQLDTYAVAYTFDQLQIGCQRHTIKEWWKMDDDAIKMMDGKRALEWWKIWKPILKKLIKESPAKETGYIAPKEKIAA